MGKLMKKIDIYLDEYNKLEEGKGDGKKYDKFFKELLKKYKVKDVEDLSRKDKKKFFAEVEKKWKGENPKTDDKDRR